MIYTKDKFSLSSGRKRSRPSSTSPSRPAGDSSSPTPSKKFNSSDGENQSESDKAKDDVQSEGVKSEFGDKKQNEGLVWCTHDLYELWIMKYIKDV